jgi:hypothetical protein
MKEMKQPQMSSYVTVGFLLQQHFMRRPIKHETAINAKCNNATELIPYIRGTINHEISVVYVLISTSS